MRKNSLHLRWKDWPACGLGYVALDALPTTDDVDEVTCGKCIKTEKFRQLKQEAVLAAPSD